MSGGRKVHLKTLLIIGDDPAHLQRWYKPPGVSTQALAPSRTGFVMFTLIVSSFETNVYLKLIKVRADQCAIYIISDFATPSQQVLL